MLWALGAAVAYGASDFIGGVTSRVEKVWAVAATGQAAATAATLPFVVATWTVTPAADVGWAVLAGIGAGAGNVLIYHGLATGRVMTVAPLAAVASTTLPVMTDIIGGRQLSHTLAAGVAVALAAGWLVSGGGARANGRSDRKVVAIGLLAGAGFGTQFAALGQIPAGSGLAPLGISQLASVVLIIAIARACRVHPVPRRGRTALAAISAGLFAGIATLLFQVSAQAGSLTVAVVLTSLYPAVTVTLGAALLRERATGVQTIGLALAAASILLVRLG